MKKTFLEHVAEHIIGHYGTDLSRIAVVFPNKRASLFLSEHLARLAGKPLWSPAYITISDLFRQQSSLSVADPIKLVCDLHKSFVRCTGIDETLDHFYGWGQLLLSDFDDIDKNMAQADKVYANLRDIHEFDDVSYLTDEQKALLRKFFANFTDDHDTRLKQKFIDLWSHFHDIYTDFNQRLRQQGLAYEGALYREVALDEQASFPYDHYLFVGFNMMQRVEQTLCAKLQREGKAHFYWDFDRYYMNGNEAGHYIAQYMEHFPNELDSRDRDIYAQLETPKRLAFISAPTENIQARYVSEWLRQQGRIAAGRKTAIVLCNEALLPTVIHCLPEEVDKVNVTTGYPLSQTPVASFIRQSLSGNRRALSRHPYYPLLGRGAPDSQPATIGQVLADIRLIATSIKEPDALAQESVFRAYTLLNRLDGLVRAGDLTVDNITLQRLVTQLLQSATIPFHGEPIEGIQLMGVLETRDLDFDHLLILSCNEGNMPRGVNDSSFIPYSIRKAFGLTTVDNKVAIYAYYFHRLLQRATDITIIYNNATEGSNRGEMSRFMLQLMVESGHPIERLTLQAGQLTHRPRPVPIEKSEPIAARLLSINRLSPTAINRYMRCQLQFYYDYVAGIKEPEDDEEDAMDNRVFGNIFHLASEKLYNRLMSRDGTVSKGDIDELLKHPEQIEMAVDRAIDEEVFGAEPESDDKRPLRHRQLNGMQIIQREVLVSYLRRLLQLDRLLAPITIRALEERVERIVRIRGQEICLGGFVDRLDVVGLPDGSERIRVVDYKTGRKPSRHANTIDEVFDPMLVREKHTDYYLQTMLYSLIVSRDARLNPHALPVSPALLFIQQTQSEGYDPTLQLGKELITDVEEHRETFSAHLNQLLNEMLDTERPFVPTDDRNICETCPYRQLCGA